MRFEKGKKRSYMEVVGEENGEKIVNIMEVEDDCEDIVSQET